MTQVISFPVRFKQTKAMDAKGIKAPESFEQSYDSLEVADIANLNPIHVVNVLNEFTMNYVKKLIASNIHSNHDYRPQNSDITFDSAYDDFSSPSKRGNRILSKANLNIFIKAYSIYLMKIGKNEKQIEMHSKIIESKFELISMKKEVLEVVAGFMSEFDYEDSKINFTDDENSIIETVYDSLNEKLVEIMETITEEITENSL